MKCSIFFQIVSRYLIYYDSSFIYRLKLISLGKVLVDNESLASQGVKHGSMILAIIIGDAQNEMKENEDQIKELEGIKSDSKLLALDDQYIEVTIYFIQ